MPPSISDEEKVWQEENTARGKLRSILGNIRSSLPQLDRALDLLETHPNLAAELFRETDNESPCLDTTYTPLAYFVQTAVQNPTKQLQLLSRTFQLYPAAIAEPSGRGRLPLHEACSLSCDEKVIRFFADSYPQAASVPDKSGLLPFHLALRGHQHASLGTLKLLLDMNPAAFDQKDFGRTWPLKRAILKGYNGEVLQMLFGKLASSLDEYSLEKDMVGTMDLVQGVSVLLPQLKKIELRLQWRGEAWERLMKELTRNTSIQHLTLELCRSSMGQLTTTSKATQQQAQRSHLRFLRLDADMHVPGVTDDAVFQVVHETVVLQRASPLLVATPPRLEHLYLYGFQLSHPALLHNLLISSYDSAPKRVSISYVSIQNIEPFISHSNQPLSAPASAVHSVEGIEFKGVGQDWLYDILLGLARRPAPLKELTLDNCTTRSPDKKLVDALQIFLRETPLKSLRVAGNFLRDAGESYLSLTELLASNTSLRKYKLDSSLYDLPGQTRQLALSQTAIKNSLVYMLQHQNTTLHEIDLRTNDQLFSHLQLMNEQRLNGILRYYTCLNRYGRAEARDTGTSRSRLVELVGQSSDVADSISYSLAGSLLYGLLRENPCIWCDDNVKARGNKRKRENGRGVVRARTRTGKSRQTNVKLP